MATPTPMFFQHCRAIRRQDRFSAETGLVPELGQSGGSLNRDGSVDASFAHRHLGVGSFWTPVTLKRGYLIPSGSVDDRVYAASGIDMENSIPPLFRSFEERIDVRDFAVRLIAHRGADHRNSHRQPKRNVIRLFMKRKL